MALAAIRLCVVAAFGRGGGLVLVVVQEELTRHKAGRRHGDEEDHGPQRAAGGEHHRGQAQNGGHHIEDTYGLLLGKAHVNKPVVNVAAVGTHGALAAEQPADDGKGHVENGQAQHQEGHHEGDDGGQLEHSLHRHRGQDIAQEGGAGVAHEDLGGVEVIGQKADARSGQGPHHHRHVLLAHQQGNDQHGHRADGGHAAGKAVQPVDEVDGVGDGHDPDEGHRDGQPPQLPHGVVAEDVGVGEDLDAVAREHRHQGRRNLHHEFQLGGQGVNVVKDAQDHDHHRAEQHALLGRVQGQQQNDADDKAEENGKTAHPGDGVVVHAAVVPWHVDGAHLDRQRFHQGGRGKGEHGGDEHGKQHRDHRGGAQRTPDLFRRHG